MVLAAEIECMFSYDDTVSQSFKHIHTENTRDMYSVLLTLEAGISNGFDYRRRTAAILLHMIVRRQRTRSAIQC